MNYCYDSPFKFGCSRSRDADYLTHEEATLRYEQKYHGRTPKARVEGNYNYYDHNILDLSSRVVAPPRSRKVDVIFDSASTLRGSKSCGNVWVRQKN